MDTVQEYCTVVILTACSIMVKAGKRTDRKGLRKSKKAAAKTKDTTADKARPWIISSSNLSQTMSVFLARSLLNMMFLI